MHHDAVSEEDISRARIAQRLQEARKRRGLTQEDAAVALGVARTTMTAIEKGERRVGATELVRLAALYGREVHELLRPGPDQPAVRAQLRVAGHVDEDLAADIEGLQEALQDLCRDYRRLEDLCAARRDPIHPPEHPLTPGIDPAMTAEAIAGGERNRLGLGDGPVSALRELLDGVVGVRVFVLDMPSKLAGMYLFEGELGPCIGLNARHPRDRARWTLAHEYGHFLTSRHTPEITYTGTQARRSRSEVFADAFAATFLMPSSGLARRFQEMFRTVQGRVTPAELCLLAHDYGVSFQAMTLRLEAVKLIPTGTWTHLKSAGFNVREAQDILHIPPPPSGGECVPMRYTSLAARAFARDLISEGELMRFLRTDRLSARETVAALETSEAIEDDGTAFQLALDFGEVLTGPTARASAESR